MCVCVGDMVRPLCKPQRERVVGAVHHNMVGSSPSKEKSSYPVMSDIYKEFDFINEDFEPNLLIDILNMLGVSSLDCLLRINYQSCVLNR